MRVRANPTNWRAGLMPLVIAALVLGAGRPAAAPSELIQIGGTGAALGTMAVLADAFIADHPGVRIEVLSYIGSTGSMKAVSEGKLPLGASGRLPKPEEADMPIRLVPYATTPMVIAVNPGVTQSHMTLTELADIYAGRRLDWPEGGRVRLILRPRRDSDNEHLRRMSADMQLAVEDAFRRPGLLHAPTDQAAVDIIERTPGGVGASTLALLVSEKRDARALALNGRVPSVAALADGSYPYAKPLYLVLPLQPTPTVKAFAAFVRSERGAKILRANGNLPAPGEGIE